MYSDTMQRTQVYLSEEELTLLDQATIRTGATRSELIRRAVRDRYGNRDWDSRRSALHASAGAWTAHPHTGESYVDAVRGDLTKRLERIGWS